MEETPFFLREMIAKGRSMHDIGFTNVTMNCKRNGPGIRWLLTLDRSPNVLLGETSRT